MKQKVTRASLSANDSTEVQTISTYYGYDFQTGNKLWEIDPNGNLTTFEYDGLGRLVQIIYPDNTDVAIDTRNLNYTARFPKRADNPCKVQIYEDKDDNNDGLYMTTVANLVSPVDMMNSTMMDKIVNDELSDAPALMFNKTQYYYDALNRLSQVYQYLRPSELTDGQTNPVVTYFGYDSNGNQDKITDAQGNITTKIYDGLKRLKQIIYPQVATYDGLNPSVKIEYIDELNKRQITYGDGSVVVEEKDWAGNVTKVSKMLDGMELSVRREYDSLGQVVKEYDQINNEVRYHYDTLRLVRTANRRVFL